MLPFRRSPWLRLIAVLLLIGSPGLGGTGLQALHGCTERMPWLADSVADPAGAAGHHGQGEHGAPVESGCHCIGHCQASPAAPVTEAAALSEADALPVTVPDLSGESRVAPAGRVAHRLPPSTAPPLI